MEKKDADELVRLLGIVAREKGYLPNQESFEAIHKIIPWAAVEILVINPDIPREFFLTRRNDQYWNGWHIPGGYVRTTHTSLIDACNSVATRELGNASAIISARLITAYLWKDHPYGNPISLVYACTVDQRPHTNDHARFFSEVPSPMVPHHVDFIHAYLQSLSGNHP